MNRKKIALIALLIAVIAAAALVALMRVRSELKTPMVLLDRKVQKIDMKSLEVFSETFRDWMTKYAPDMVGRYRNPRTGEYTIVEAMKCASCGQLIPVPQMPAGLEWKPNRGRGSGPEARAAMMAQMTAIVEFQRNYKCPKCGKNAFVLGPIPSPNPNPNPPKSK